MKIIASSFVAASLLAGAPAFAQGTSAQRAACTPDVFRLCSSEIPNVDAIRACLRTKKASLSSDCRAVFDTLDKVKTAQASTGVATRSIGPAKVGFCDFTEQAPGDKDWIQWCGPKAFKE